MLNFWMFFVFEYYLYFQFLAENVPENLKSIFSQDCRQALTEMIEAQGSSDAILSSNKKKNLALSTQADSPIKFSQLSKANDLASAGDIFELGNFHFYQCFYFFFKVHI